MRSFLSQIRIGKEVLAALRERGPLFIYHYFAEVVFFDWLHGTDTRRRKMNVVRGTGAVHYVPSFTSVVRTTLRRVRALSGKRFDELQFFDIGCGKAKVLLIYAREFGKAARHPPKGIEYDPELCSAAKKNIDRMDLARSGVEVMCADARLAPGYVTAERAVFFLYNPFAGALFREFVQSVASVPHWLIYVDPVEKPVLLDMGYRIVEAVTGRYHADSWLIAVHDGDRGDVPR